MRIISIDGKKYEYEGLIQNGRAIKAGGRIFVLFPAARLDGGPLEPLPRVGPSEVRRVTVNVPDLCKDHPDTVKHLYDQLQDYYKDVTYEQHLHQNPQEAWITKLDFEKGKSRILAQSVESFAASQRAREAVWHEHKTDEMAAEAGYLELSEQVLLVSAFKRQRLSEDAAWAEVRRIQWEAVYPDPAQTRLFLYDLAEEPDPSSIVSIVPKSKVHIAKIEEARIHEGDVKKLADAVSARLNNRQARQKAKPTELPVPAARPNFCWQSEGYTLVHLPVYGGELQAFTVPQELSRVFRALDAAPNKTMSRHSIWEALGKTGTKDSFRPDKLYSRWKGHKYFKKPLMKWRKGVFTLHPPEEKLPRKPPRK